jgi:hypothetical protein
MKDLSDLDVSREEALVRAKKFFNGKQQFVSIIDRNADVEEKESVKWMVNVDSFYE